jgi:hypothetical protein
MNRPIPDRLVHVTRPAAVDSIRERGLLGEPFVFAAETVTDGLRFMGLRLSIFLTGSIIEQQITRPDGTVETVNFPEVEQNTHAAVVTFETAGLDAERLTISDDHSAAFFAGAPSWVYVGSVPPEAITSVELIPLR